MNSKLVTAAGVLLVIAGAAGLYSGYENQAVIVAALGFAAVIAGAVVLMYGASGMASGPASKPAERVLTRHHDEWQVRLLVQCMGAVAAADGAVSPDELAAISRISERMMGRRMASDDIAGMVAELKGPAVAKRLAEERDRLPAAMRQTIVKSCYLVMMSDLDEGRREIGKVREIGRALGFSAQETDDLIAMAGV